MGTRLYSYILSHDTGFAPNPFHGWCTLANCKPVIRRTARPGDWLAGLSPKSDGNRLVYAMQVQESLPYAAYFLDARFQAKKPVAGQDPVLACGDNIYEPLSVGGFRQLPSLHSCGECEDEAKKAWDLAGINVLVSERFWYFGWRAVELAETLDALRVGRGHRAIESDAVIAALTAFLGQHEPGLRGWPSAWSRDSVSTKASHPCVRC